jgi:SAM-dependent methyltransferase
MKIPHAFLAVSLLTMSLFSARLAAQEETAPLVIDVKELSTGEDAPNTEVIAEVVRVAMLDADPEARARPGTKPGTIEVEANTEAIILAGLQIKRLEGRPAADRIEPEMLYVEGRRTRDGIGRYFFDREIAQVMGHLGANWLERPTREKEERTSLLIELLGVETDTDVADIGAGTGYFTFPIARKATEGTVHAVDIQPEMLEFIEARKRHEDIDNVKGVLGTIMDSKLEPESIDLAFAVDAYHEFSNPWEMLQSIRKALRPGGRLILVEFRLEDPEVPIKLLHKMSQAQARRELEAAGFEWVRTEDQLPRQHILIFRKPKKDPVETPVVQPVTP